MIYQIGEAYIKSLTQHGITTIEFFHPKSNSLPAEMLHSLSVAIDEAGLDEECLVIVLKSGGDGAFCAGANFDELLQIETPEQGLRFFSGFGRVINAMRKCPKLIIGRIQGKCTGGGVGLAAACDYAIAVEGADIKLSELAVGIGPYVVGPAIQRKIGFSAFSQLAIDAYMWRNADWAKRKGLYAELHTDREGMEESVRRLAGKLAHSNPEATRQLKKIFWQGTEDWDELLKERARISGSLVVGKFTREAIEKFKKKSADQ
ncbi:MAG TPA: enoyl-CoA hydratase/isomerase family protein [Phnomibacter sp.]|nr:enoyl-CoA hydratase/isomerase family protein [Phnomibacter sp.]